MVKHGGNKGHSKPKQGGKQNAPNKKEYLTKKQSTIRRDKTRSLKRNSETGANVDKKSITLSLSQAERSSQNLFKSNASFDIIPCSVPFFNLSSNPNLFSRLLYPNPVCFLSTLNQSSGSISIPNVMTLSWLMPTNNYGGFAFTIHKTRFSANTIIESESKTFVLSIPTALHRGTLLAIGKCSGQSKNKFDGSIAGLEMTRLGYFNSTASQPIDFDISKNDEDLGDYEIKSTKEVKQSIIKRGQTTNTFSALNDEDDDDDEESDEADDEPNEINDEDEPNTHQEFHVKSPISSPNPKSSEGISVNDIAIAGSVAHMRCKLVSHSDASDPGHYLFLAQIEQAFVHPNYWSKEGKCFLASGNLPPYLTFLGSQHFGLVKGDDLC